MKTTFKSYHMQTGHVSLCAVTGDTGVVTEVGPLAVEPWGDCLTTAGGAAAPHRCESL